MTMANVSKGSACGLPQALRTAQEAIHLPEVQETRGGLHSVDTPERLIRP